MSMQFTYERRKDVYEQALAAFGAQNQITIAIEEMSELIKELCKLNRNRTNNERIAEEIADVTVMIEQLRLIFDINDLVAEKMDWKMRRLKFRLEKGEN